MNIGLKSLYDESILLYAGENEWELQLGDLVIFSHGERKAELGKIVFFDRQKVTTETILNGKILRRADEKDLVKSEDLKKKAATALQQANEKVKELGLAMQLMEARYSFDEAEINLFFAAEDRVDFRELVPRLAGLFKKRIHLQQIGPRDRAKMLGGFGICGRELCCEKVLTKFHSVTMDMARKQEMIMKGSDKLSGACGKLMCCLAYEVKEYERLRKTMPEYGSRVTTPSGPAKVIGLDVLNQNLKVYLDSGGVQFFTVAEIQKGAAAKIEKPIRINSKK